MGVLTSYEIDSLALFIIILASFFVGTIALSKQSSPRMKLLIVIMLMGVFFYSGYGISYRVVDNKYILCYIIFIICLCIPFILFNKRCKDSSEDFTQLDFYIVTHRNLIRNLAFAFLFCYFVPLVYPEFKLFNIFKSPGFLLENLWEDRWSYKENTIIVMIDAFKAFFQPFFYIYITQLQIDKVKNRKVVLLFMSVVLMLYMRYSYLGRYQMMLFGLIIYLLAFCVKGYEFKISKKNVSIIIAVVLALIPSLYAFTFIRQGTSADSGLSFNDIVGLLIDSEAYYPIYYDVALHSTALQGQTPLTFILWLLFLPIPSFIFPGKPTLQGDAFTYAVTGKSFGDANFSSALPSVLGESFMFFGEEYYWVSALIIGCVIFFVINFLTKHKTLNFFTIYLIVFSLTLGRGGASSYMSTIINGSLSVFVLYFYVKHTKNTY